MIPMNSKKSVLINAMIFAVIIVGFVTVNFFTSEPTAKIVSFENVGLQVPLKRLNGDISKTASLKEYRGQNILIHFWASWCDACAADHKVMEQLALSYQGNTSIKIIGIASSDTQKAIDESGLIKKSSYPQFLDETGNLALALGVKSLPQTILIDSTGRVLFQLARPFDAHQHELIENRINALSETQVPPFVFENTEGKPVTENSLGQKVWVADFMFTSCPDMCPMLTAKMHLLQEAFKSDDRFKMVSITVDPETDTKAVLKNYEKKFKVDPEKWYFLRGNMDAVKSLLVNGFKLGTMEEPQFHSGKFILVDQTNKIRGYYDADASESFEKLKVDIAKLLK